jgi:phthiocerol/phenolphthiocerol synthesis type-I polyketide synthase B
MSAALEDFAALPRERTLASARRWAAAYLGHILGVPPEQVELAQSISAHGIDSVDAVVMAGAMEEHFRVELDAGLFLNESSLEANIAQLRDDPQWQDS